MSKADSIKTKRPKFLEKWGQAEENNGTLKLVVYGLLFLCVIQTAALVKPKAIYFIPGAREAGTAYPNKIPEGSIMGFASSWVLNWTNFNPETIDIVYERSIKFMAPRLLSRTKANLEAEIQSVKNKRMSSMFSLVEEPELFEKRNGYLVVLKGQKSIYLGKEQIDQQEIMYKIFMKQVPPTKVNPYGLLIVELKQEKTVHKKVQ